MTRTLRTGRVVASVATGILRTHREALMDQPALETASVDDVAGLLALREQLAAWLALRGIDQWQSPMSRDRLVTWVRDGSVHVVRRDDRIVASVALLERDEEFWGPDSDSALYVHLLMVARSHAGHDLGGRVLARAETLARAAGSTAFDWMPQPTTPGCSGGTSSGATALSDRAPSARARTSWW